MLIVVAHLFNGLFDFLFIFRTYFVAQDICLAYLYI